MNDAHPTTYDEPSEVHAVDGKVTVDGPDSVDVNLTPEAAEVTADRLTEQAVKARGQRRIGKLSMRPR